MRYEHREENGYLVLNIQELRLDSTKIEAFKETMQNFIHAGKSSFLLNLGNLRYIDSRGLGAILSVHEMLENRGSIVLCEAKETVKSFLSLTRMDRIFTIFETEADALAAVVSHV